MRIRVKQSRRRLDRITLSMASMIDVTFLLLAYFLITMVVLKPEDRLSPAIQTISREAGSASDFQPQRIEVLMIDGAPAYRLGNRVMRDREALAEAMDPLPRQVGVFIAVQDQVLVGFAVAAVQVARDLEFEQVTYVPAK